jgi:hypothetical protein
MQRTETKKTKYTVMFKVTNITWPLLGRAVTALRELPYNYRLNYSRSSELADPDPWLSGKYPGFSSDYPLNSFQLIWDEQEPTRVFLNHGYPDVYNDARKALTNAGFLLVEQNPHKR